VSSGSAVSGARPAAFRRGDANIVAAAENQPRLDLMSL
jgi:hypothetical protein